MGCTTIYIIVFPAADPDNCLSPDDESGYTTGASTTEIRFDGSIATSGKELNISNTAITTGGTTTVDSVEMTMPAS